MSTQNTGRHIWCSAAVALLVASGSALAETSRFETVGQLAAAHTGAPASTQTPPNGPQVGTTGSPPAAATGAPAPGAVRSDGQVGGTPETMSSGTAGEAGATGTAGAETGGSVGGQTRGGADGTPGSKAGSTTGGTAAADEKHNIGESYGAATASSGTSNSPSRNDRNMVQNLAMANLAELSAARLALSKAQNPQVKEYAQQMINDHTKAMDDLKSFAQSKNMTLPTKPDVQHQSAVASLKGQPADDFAEEYLKQSGVTDHRNTLRLLEDIRDDADDPELKKLAEKMIPVVENHLQRGELLAGVKGMSKPRDMQSEVPAAR